MGRYKKKNPIPYQLTINKLRARRRQIKSNLKEMYGWDGRTDVRTNKYLVYQAYMEATKDISKHIQTVKQVYNILDRRVKYVSYIADKIKDFFLISSIKWKKRELTSNERETLGRMILCTYVYIFGKTRGITSGHVASYLNKHNLCSSDNIREWRYKFKELLSSDEGVREKWENFKIYMDTLS